MCSIRTFWIRPAVTTYGYSSYYSEAFDEKSIAREEKSIIIDALRLKGSWIKKRKRFDEKMRIICTDLGDQGLVTDNWGRGSSVIG